MTPYLTPSLTPSLTPLILTPLSRLTDTPSKDKEEHEVTLRYHFRSWALLNEVEKLVLRPGHLNMTSKRTSSADRSVKPVFARRTLV